MYYSYLLCLAYWKKKQIPEFFTFGIVPRTFLSSHKIHISKTHSYLCQLNKVVDSKCIFHMCFFFFLLFSPFLNDFSTRNRIRNQNRSKNGKGIFFYYFVSDCWIGNVILLLFLLSIVFNSGEICGKTGILTQVTVFFLFDFNILFIVNIKTWHFYRILDVDKFLKKFWRLIGIYYMYPFDIFFRFSLVLYGFFLWASSRKFDLRLISLVV